MSTLGWIALILIIALLAALIAFLFLPVVFTGELRANGQISLSVRARLLGGRAPPIRLVPVRRSAKTPKTNGGKPGKSLLARTMTSLGQVSSVMPAVPKLIGDLLRSLDVRDISIDAEFGLEDPADTGKLYGHLCAILCALPAKPGRSLHLRPHFDGARLEGTASASVSVRPAALIPPFASFGWLVWGASR